MSTNSRRRKEKTKKQSGNFGLCGNPAGCYRPANGTDGIGWCMMCEDDSGHNQPMNNKARKQYERESHPAVGSYWVHKKTGKLFDGKNRRYVPPSSKNPFK